MTSNQLIFPSSIPTTGGSVYSSDSETADDIVLDGPYTLGGTGYTLSLSGASNNGVAIDAESGSSTIAAPINLGSGGVDLEAGSGAEIDVTGDVSASGNTVYVGHAGGSGTIVLSGNNPSLTDNIFVYDGTLEVGSSTALGTGSIDVLGGADSMVGNGVLALEGGVTVSNHTLYAMTGTLEATGPGTATWGGPVPIYWADQDQTATFAAATGSFLDVSGAVSDGGFNTSVVVGKSGGWGGTVELSGSGDSWTGTTTVSDGTLEDGADNGVSSNSALDVAAGATLELNGHNQQIGSMTGSGTGTIDDSGAAADLTLGASSTYNVGETITGAANIVAYTNGVGDTITLSGDNSYTGSTTVEGFGALALASSSALGSTSGVTIGNTSGGYGGTLELDGNITVPSTVPLTIQDGVLDLAGAAGTTGAWDGPVVLAGPPYSNTFAAAPGDTLEVNGLVSGSSSPQIDVGAAGMTGTVDLTAANTYTGSTTTVTDGTLEVGNDDALGTGSIEVGPGAALSLDSGISVPNSVNMNDLAGVLEADGGTGTWAGAVELDSVGTLAAASGASLDVSGQMCGGALTSGTSGLTGTVELSGSFPCFGATTVAYGTLQDAAATGALPYNQSLDVASGATFDLYGNDQQVGSLGSGAGTITSSTGAPTLDVGWTSSGPGLGADDSAGEALSGSLGLAVEGGSHILTLSGSDTFTGSTAVKSGTLALAGNSALGTSATHTSGVTVDPSAILDLTGGVPVPSAIPITDLAGTLETTDTSGADTWAGPIALDGTYGGSLAAYAGSTLAVSGVVSGGALGVGTPGMLGTVDLQTANSFSGGTTVQDGTLEIGSSSALGPTSGLGDSVGSGAVLALDNGVSVPSSLDIFDLAGVLEADSGTATWAGAVGVDAGGTLAAAPGTTLDVSGAVGDDPSSPGATLTLGTATLTGTVDLSSDSNGFTGATTVAYGTLQDGTANALPTATKLAVALGATFDLNGNDQTVASLGSSAGTITNAGSSGATLTDQESGTSTVAATLTNGANPLNFVMAGSGTVNLAGLNSYTGATTVAGASGTGTLEVSNNSPLGATSGVTVDSGTTLDMTAGVSIPSTIPITDLAGTLETSSGIDTWGGVIALDNASTGSLQAALGSTLHVTGVVSGDGLSVGAPGMPGTVDLMEANTYTGGTNVVAGTLDIDNAYGVSSGSVAVETGAVLALDSGISVPNSVNLSDLAGVLEADSGTATWAGDVGVDSEGTLAADSGATLDVSGVVGDSANPGAMLTSGAAGLTGTVDLSNGSNDYTGATTVAHGTLQDGIANALPTTTALDVASGATFDLNGYAQRVASLGSDSGTITDAGVAANLTVGNLGADDTAQETLAGSLNLVVDGHGHTLTLPGTDTYAGATTVASGTLDVTGSLASAVTPSSGAILEGTGTVRDAAAGGGVIEPGDASTHEGTLTTTSGADLSAAGSALTVVIGGTGAGTYGQLTVSSGTLNVTGATLNVSFSSGFTSAAGDIYDIVANSGGRPVTGTFAGLPEGGELNVGGRTLEISYVGGGSGHDIVLTDTPPIHVYSGGGGRGITSTAVSIQVSPTSAAQGQSVTYSATVTAAAGSSGTLTGNVAFSTGSTSLCTASLSGSGGTATGSCSATNAPVGTDTVTGTYSGDANFAASSGQTVLTVAAPAESPSFSDVPAGYWAYQAIESLAAKGIIGGFPDGTFRPGMAVTRAQFVKMLVLALNLKPGSGATTFTDVPQGSWVAPYVAAAVEAGIVQGLSPTRFGPGETITREQMAVLIARAFKLGKTHPLHFSDAGQIGAWALQGVEETVAAGYMSGFPDGTFRPLGTTTRAQAAKVLFTALQQSP